MRAHSSVARLFAVTLFLVSPMALGDDYFTNLRVDNAIPKECQETVLSDFPAADELETFTYTTDDGSEQAKRFTYQYPMSRNASPVLWRAAKNKTPLEKFRGSAEMISLYEIIIREMPIRNFKFHNEGDTLELLGTVALEEDVYPTDEFFITGGVEYHTLNPRRTIGEIDYVVGERETCAIKAVGQAKLSPKRSSDSNEQNARLIRFLKGVQNHSEMAVEEAAAAASR